MLASPGYWIESAGIEATAPLDPLRGSHKADVVIIGGGYTGLSTALHLSERYPDRRVVLLEASRVGSGASGRNDGLVLPFIHGAEPIVRELLASGQVERARSVYEKTSAGIGIIERLASVRGVDCDWERVDCLRAAMTLRQETCLEREWEMYRALGIDTEWVPSAALCPRIQHSHLGALRIRVGGMVHPAKLARGVLAAVRARGVDVHERSPVFEIEPGPKISVRAREGTIRASALVLATNAYTAKLGYLRRRILPVHSYSVATAPLPDAAVEHLGWRGRESLLDVRNLFELFRLTRDNRVVYSGGDAFYCFNGAITDRADHPDYSRLESRFRALFPTLSGVPIAYRWVGHVGLTLDQVPTIGTLGPARNIFFAGGYSGHGVPVAFLAGRLIRDLYAGEALDSAYDFIAHRRPPATAPEPLSSIGFALYKRYLRWADAR